MTITQGDLPTHLQFELHHRLALTIEDGRTTIDDMAEVLGYHRNTILNYVSGRTKPRRNDVREWALRCGVSYRWLDTGEEEIGTPDGGDTARDSTIRCTVLPLGRGYLDAA